jgi:hypothetical protein
VRLHRHGRGGVGVTADPAQPSPTADELRAALIASLPFPPAWARAADDPPAPDVGDEAAADCGCPLDPQGVIRHRRGVCTDPVVERLNWYADTAAGDRLPGYRIMAYVPNTRRAPWSLPMADMHAAIEAAGIIAQDPHYARVIVVEVGTQVERASFFLFGTRPGDDLARRSE